MTKYLTDVVLGVLGTSFLLLFFASYALACIVFGWAPDLSAKTWALIAIGLSSIILMISYSLWKFTRFKEGIHGWTLIPPLFLGELWINSLKEVTFQGIILGSIYIGIISICLVCFAFGLSCFIKKKRANELPMIKNDQEEV